MNHSDIAALMKGAAPVIREYLAGAVQPLVDKIAELEGRLNSLPAPILVADIERRIETVTADLKASAETARAEGKEKRKAALANLKTGIIAECETMVAAKFAELPEPTDFVGMFKSHEEKVEVFVRSAIAAIPAQEPETDLAEFFEQRMGEQRQFLLKEFTEAIPPLPDIPAMIADAVAAIPAPQDGKDADPELVASLVKDEAERILAGWERPKDGEKGEPGRDGANGADGKDGEPGINGKDGLDAVEFLRGDNGHLIVTMSNGTTRDLGQYVGKDGAPGMDAAPGKDGRDGFGFDDMTMEYDGKRSFAFVMKRAADVSRYEFKAPVLIDQGVWKEGTQYETGDGVTWGGSFWIAQKDNADKPDSGNGSWRLAVKKGRDGKDGSLKPEPPKTPVKVG